MLKGRSMGSIANCSRLAFLKVLWGSMDELHSDELEATLLKPLDDVANKSALDTVGLVGCPQLPQ